MDVSKQIIITRIQELKILQNVRILYKHDLNPLISSKNLRVQFDITGEVVGCVICYLFMDNIDFTLEEKNFIFPLFVESMNILIGKQFSHDEDIANFKLKLHPPKINFNSSEINSKLKNTVHKYVLELDDKYFNVLTEYNLTYLN